MTRLLADLSVRTKILAAVGVVIMLSGVGGALALSRMHSSTAALQSAEHSEALALAASELHSAFQVQDETLRDLELRGGDPTAYAVYTDAFSANGQDVRLREAALRGQLAGSVDVRAADRLLAAFDAGYATSPATTTRSWPSTPARAFRPTPPTRSWPAATRPSSRRSARWPRC